MSTTTVLGNLYFDWANDPAFTPYVRRRHRLWLG